MAIAGSRESRRTFLRFSLCTLLLVVTGAATLCGVWAERARRQRIAVNELQEMGAIVRYDYQGTDLHPTGNEPIIGSTALSIDFFHSPIMVRLWHQPGLKALPALKQLPHLRQVQYGYGTIGDDVIVETLRTELPGVEIVVFNAAVG
jgi:hypothetical protein